MSEQSIYSLNRQKVNTEKIKLAMHISVYECFGLLPNKLRDPLTTEVRPRPTSFTYQVSMLSFKPLHQASHPKKQK